MAGGTKKKSVKKFTRSVRAIKVLGEKKQRKKKRKESYSSYLMKVLRIVHPDMNISKMAMAILNSFMNDMFERITSEASRLVQMKKSKTLLSHDVQCAVKLMLNGELALYAATEGKRALNKSYLMKVLRVIHPDLDISKMAMDILNSFMNDMFEKIASEASHLAQLKRKKTLSGWDIFFSVRLLLRGDLAAHALHNGTRVYKKYYDSFGN